MPVSWRQLFFQETLHPRKFHKLFCEMLLAFLLVLALKNEKKHSLWKFGCLFFEISGKRSISIEKGNNFLLGIEKKTRQEYFSWLVTAVLTCNQKINENASVTHTNSCFVQKNSQSTIFFFHADNVNWQWFFLFH